MVLLIIIPFLNGYFIGKINPTFSDKPTCFFPVFVVVHVCLAQQAGAPTSETTGWFGTEGNVNSSNQAPKLMDGSDGYVCIYIYIHIYIYIYVYLFMYYFVSFETIYSSIYLCMYLFIYLSIYLCIYLFIYLFICVRVCVCVHFLSGFVWKCRLSLKHRWILHFPNNETSAGCVFPNPIQTGLVGSSASRGTVRAWANSTAGLGSWEVKWSPTDTARTGFRPGGCSIYGGVLNRKTPAGWFMMMENDRNIFNRLV